MFGFGGGEDVEHTSGLQRALSSVLCAVCGFPIVLIGGAVLLGWNEKRDVCEQAAILSGQDAFKQVGCTDATQEVGNLVFFTCDLNQSSITPGLYQDLNAGDFSSVLSSYVGTGVRIEAEMDVCVEKSNTEKDSVGGGTTTVYSYERALVPSDHRTGLWMSRRIAAKETRRKRVMQMAKVHPDRVKLYRRHHQAVWPEVERGLAGSGVETISIWADPNDETSLFMYLELADDAEDLGPGSRYRTSDTVREWEEKMETEFHAGWTPLQEWYTLKAAGSRSVQVSTNSLPP
ncbi:unnamed protein product, partial [Symbiodinium sp. CCMP2592]